MFAEKKRSPLKRAGRRGGSKQRRKGASRARRIARIAPLAAAAVLAVLCTAGFFFSRHPREWLEEKESSWPRFAVRTLLYFGDRTRFVTDGLGWTGHDAVYEFDEPAPEGCIFFAGAPVRKGAPAPDDIVTITHDAFAVGWSPSLRRPVWAAYHVPREARFPDGTRPSFRRDRSVPSSPSADAYATTGYDRGHMAPNHAIVSRFGPDEQKKTFLMTNIAPQSPSLNRGPWREVERDIADFWTARYGEIWVVVAAVPAQGGTSRETLSGSGVDVPAGYGMAIAAQTDEGVRTLAVYMPQTIDYGSYPVHNIVTVDELEAMTGLDFFAELPEFIQNPLEAELPTRLWPVRFIDIFGQIAARIRR